MRKQSKAQTLAVCIRHKIRKFARKAMKKKHKLCKIENINTCKHGTRKSIRVSRLLYAYIYIYINKIKVK